LIKNKIVSIALNPDSVIEMTEIAYQAEQATNQTFAQLNTLANKLLQWGFAVIVDGTFLALDKRQDFYHLATKNICPFVIIDCIATTEIIKQRIIQRAFQSSDASEANIDVMRQQLDSQEPFTELEKPFVVDIDTQLILSQPSFYIESVMLCLKSQTLQAD
jgi:predicted kinase